jgi:hypothetical protein
MARMGIGKRMFIKNNMSRNNDTTSRKVKTSVSFVKRG